jgi:hypothetical protein
MIFVGARCQGCKKVGLLWLQHKQKHRSISNPVKIYSLKHPVVIDVRRRRKAKRGSPLQG